jgi:hypothetical protein
MKFKMRKKFTDLRQELVHDTVTNIAGSVGRPTLLEDGIELIEYDDVQSTFISSFFVLVVFRSVFFIKQENEINSNLLLCIAKQLSYIFLRLANILVQNLWTVDDFRLAGIEHLANLPGNESFSRPGRAVK